jgi:hypothetical protein
VLLSSSESFLKFPVGNIYDDRPAMGTGKGKFAFGKLVQQ